MSDESIERYHLRKVREANDAIQGLLHLQRKLEDETGIGEMPGWWGPFYQEAVNKAIEACAESAENSIDWINAAILEQGR